MTHATLQGDSNPLEARWLRVMQLRLNANELTLDRKWLYAPLAANSRAITILSLAIFLLLTSDDAGNFPEYSTSNSIDIRMNIISN